jgi:uncharacterized membrane protein YtjA (UPF0391 family)
MEQADSCQAEAVKMKTRGLGRLVMAAGMACILLYILLALRRPSTFDAGGANILFYVGVVALPLGLTLLWTGVLKRGNE